MRTLIIKTSSLGDVIHTLPAVTDLQRAKPEMQIDWVVEASFAEIPRWHYAVNTVIPVQLRRWRKHPFQPNIRGEFKEFVERIRAMTYDVVLDAQGLFKSAFISILARGSRHGFDFKSAREPLATLVYDHSHHVPRNQHAILRVRHLFAQTFGYTLPEDLTPDYGLDTSQFILPFQLELKQNYLVFLHGTTWKTKHWPDAYWKELLQLAAKANWQVVLPWGNDIEFLRAQELSQESPAAYLLPKLSLSEVAAVLANAKGVVSVDSGLGHLSCALNVPVVGLYGPTKTDLTGMTGGSTIALSSNSPSCAPCLQRECTYKGNGSTEPACFSQINPKLVFDTLNDLITQKSQQEAQA